MLRHRVGMAACSLVVALSHGAIGQTAPLSATDRASRIALRDSAAAARLRWERDRPSIYTIDGLFDELQSALSDTLVNVGDVSFDQRLGFPLTFNTRRRCIRSPCTTGGWADVRVHALAEVRDRETNAASQEIPALIRQLADGRTEWSAASRLQKLGAPAIAALVANLRQDGFRDRDHGNHSPTMRALEKFGPAAVDAVRGALPALDSSDPDDVRFMETAIRVLSTIGGDAVPAILVRLGSAAGDAGVRESAFSHILWPRADFDERPARRPWEACFWAIRASALSTWRRGGSSPRSARSFQRSWPG